METLTKEDVLHVADLARLEVKEEDIPYLQTQLKQLLNEIEKINQLDEMEEEIMISPSENRNRIREDVIEPSLPIQDVLKNAPHANGSYIEVVGALHD